MNTDKMDALFLLFLGLCGLGEGLRIGVIDWVYGIPVIIFVSTVFCYTLWRMIE